MKHSIPSTRAVFFLRERKIAFEGRLYTYRGQGDVAKTAALELGLPEPQVFKTLVFQSEGRPLIAVIDATHRVSLSKLTDAVGAHRRVEEASIRDAERFTGYQVGGISPFGTKREMPVFLDSGAMNFDRIYINGGSRGFFLSLSPNDLVEAVKGTVVDLV